MASALRLLNSGCGHEPSRRDARTSVIQRAATSGGWPHRRPDAPALREMPDFALILAGSVVR